MAESNFITVRDAQPKSSANRSPSRPLAAIDLLNARHTQMLGIMKAILLDLGEESQLSKYEIEDAPWAAQALLEQAQDAARSL